MATIEPYDTKAGRRYRVIYRRPDGKQTSKRGFTTKRDAEQWSAKNTVDIMTGAYVAPAAGRRLFSDVAADWAGSQHHLAPSTTARYRHIGDQLTEKFGHLPLSKVTRPLLRSYVAELVDDRTPAETIHKTVGVLRRILALAVEDGRLAVNPAEGLRLPPIVATEMRFLDLEQLRALAEAAGPDQATIWTLGVCGLRMGELVGLQHQDVDRSAGVLHIVRSVTIVNSKLTVGPPKNGKRRAVPLPSFVAEQLPAGIGESPVFPSPTGGLIRHNNWRRRVFDPAVKRVGLELHPHELRHTAASLAIAAGANVKAVQAMLGHARASITLDRYGHLYPADVEAITSTLNTLLMPST
ncbi:tyrosine-type recombinase/integrase [Gordonia aichiensis]|uniref:tyrosine-type recombinase/integrase n=1 Tax=Gordonia aichiensis TaxID=36820 RepID=UPI00326730A3